jgi:hypothetical protein
MTPEERQRELRYNAKLARLKPGATRSDLEKLFPSQIHRADVPIPPPRSWPAPELFSLDADFTILVKYDYPAAHNERIPPHLAGVTMSSTAVDALLFGPRITNLPLQARRR